MRPNRQQTFATEAAAKLDHLELVAALLERDASNRALLADLSYLHTPAVKRRKAPLSGGWHKLVRGCAAVASGTAGVMTAVARSRRLHAALRAIYEFAVDFALVLATATVAVAILTLACLLTAPPV